MFREEDARLPIKVTLLIGVGIVDRNMIKI